MLLSKLLLFCLVLLFSSLSASGVSSSQLNFDWYNTTIYSDDPTIIQPILSVPEDFLVTNTSIIIVNTGCTDINQIIKFNLDSPNTPIPYKVNSSGLLYSITEAGSSYYLGGSGSLLLTSKNFNVTEHITMIGTIAAGLTLDRGLLYVSNYNCCRVGAFSEAGYSFKDPIIYGQPNGTAKLPPGPTLGSLHRKTVVDPVRSLLWVADYFNGRVVGYPLVANGSSYIPQIVLGQRNDSSLFLARDPNTLAQPAALAFNADYSVMFVADQHRIVRYRAPFSTGQAAEGMLGFSSFFNNFYNSVMNATDSTFVDLFAIHFTDYKNGTGKLYVLDRGSNRVVAGITSTKPLPNYPLYCNNPTAVICNVQGSVNVASNQSLTLGPSQQLQVIGDITFNPGSTVNVSQGQIISSTGTIIFNGVLVIVIKNDTRGSNNITVFGHKGSQGEFSSIQVIDEEENTGCRKEGKGEYGATSMMVLISEVCDEENEEGSATTKVILGVVLGVGGCIIVFLSVATVIIAIATYVRNKRSVLT